MQHPSFTFTSWPIDLSLDPEGDSILPPLSSSLSFPPLLLSLSFPSLPPSLPIQGLDTAAGCFCRLWGSLREHSWVSAVLPEREGQKKAWAEGCHSTLPRGSLSPWRCGTTVPGVICLRPLSHSREGLLKSFGIQLLSHNLLYVLCELRLVPLPCSGWRGDSGVFSWQRFDSTKRKVEIESLTWLQLCSLLV
jgi:hypothetical protein